MTLRLVMSRLIPVLLLLAVASRDRIIIYNEEMLVALSFILFVWFSLSWFGDQAAESLDERGEIINHSLCESAQNKQHTSKKSRKEHLTISHLILHLEQLERLTERELGKTDDSLSQLSSSMAEKANHSALLKLTGLADTAERSGASQNNATAEELHLNVFNAMLPKNRIGIVFKRARTARYLASQAGISRSINALREACRHGVRNTTKNSH